MKLKVDVEEITWECGDCKNRYDYGVEHCPNKSLDIWLLKFNSNKRGTNNEED